MTNLDQDTLKQILAWLKERSEHLSKQRDFAYQTYWRIKEEEVDFIIESLEEWQDGELIK